MTITRHDGGVLEMPNRPHARPSQAGWLTFVPREKDTILRTDQETLQSTEGDLAYWAGGLGPAYIEGALQRATDA